MLAVLHDGSASRQFTRADCPLPIIAARPSHPPLTRKPQDRSLTKLGAPFRSPAPSLQQSDGSGHKISTTPALRLRAVKHSDFHPCFRERSWWDFRAIFQPMSSRSGRSLCQDRSRPRSDYAANFQPDLAAAPLGTGEERSFPPLSALLIRPLLASPLTGEVRLEDEVVAPLLPDASLTTSINMAAASSRRL